MPRQFLLEEKERTASSRWSSPSDFHSERRSSWFGPSVCWGSPIFRKQLEVRPGMDARRTGCRALGAFVDISAVQASPRDGPVSLNARPFWRSCRAGRGNVAHLLLGRGNHIKDPADGLETFLPSLWRRSWDTWPTTPRSHRWPRPEVFEGRADNAGGESALDLHLRRPEAI